MWQIETKLTEVSECQTRDSELDSVGSGMSLNSLTKVDRVNLEAGFEMV